MAKVPAEWPRHIDAQHFAIQDWKEAGGAFMGHAPGAAGPSDGSTKLLGWALHERHARQFSFRTLIPACCAHALHTCCSALVDDIPRMRSKELTVGFVEGPKICDRSGSRNQMIVASKYTDQTPNMTHPGAVSIVQSVALLPVTLNE